MIDAPIGGIDFTNRFARPNRDLEYAGSLESNGLNVFRSTGLPDSCRHRTGDRLPFVLNVAVTIITILPPTLEAHTLAKVSGIIIGRHLESGQPEPGHDVAQPHGRFIAIVRHEDFTIFIEV